MNKRETLGRILYKGFVPTLVDDTLPLVPSLEQIAWFGLEAVEISCRHPHALDLIAQAKRHFPQMAIGAAMLVEDGRLRDFLNASDRPLPSIAQCVDAGADFLTSALPFSEATYERYRDSHVLVAGAASVAEGLWALDHGANLLQFTNPHLLGGPEFFRAMDLATYRSFPYFVTGALKSYHVGGYVAIGALAVGVTFDQILGPDYRPMQRAFDEEIVLERLEPFTESMARSRRHYHEAVPFETRDPEAISKASGRLLNL